MTSAKSYPIFAYHVGDKLNLESITQQLNLDVIKSESAFLLLQETETKTLYAKDYGSLVFCGYTENEREIILKKIVPNGVQINEFPNEEYTLNIGEDSSISVDTQTINCPSYSIDFLHIIMFNLGQTVALDFYQEKVNELLEKTRHISAQLEETGNVKSSRKKLRKFVGQTMGLKNRMAENLYIFETSDLAWSDGELSELDSLLRKELEVMNRHRGIQHSLDTVKENIDLYRDILHHQHSSALEWIIIALIAVEIVQLLIERF
ncbi:MAG: RMD1 family protein [Flavobacteriales bacterium]